MNLIDNYMYRLEKAVDATWNFFNGKFGRYILNQPYRKWWKIFWLVINVWMFIKAVLFPLFGWWDDVVRFLNGVIWG